RFSHTLFALPFALLAALMAWHIRWPLADWAEVVGEQMGHQAYYVFPFLFDWNELIGLLLCMVAGRSAAMAFNRLADRKFDTLNPRTADRHLPTRILSVRSVAIFSVGSSIAFVAGTLLFLPNPLPLTFAPWILMFLLGYSFAKRFTALSHFWLGTALGLAPVSAWIAIRGGAVIHDFHDIMPAIILGASIMFWVAGFDIIYSCQDVEFDRLQGLRSIPARYGVKAALAIAAVCHAGMVILLAIIPLVYPLMIGWIWWAGVAGIACLLIYEHRLVAPDDLTRVNLAFFNVNGVISVGLLIIGTAAMYFYTIPPTSAG
ncbi:MAG TPA: 4-hydroxybenzoate octaprenyltransferase, partial [Pirellulales bacterium]